MMSRCGEDAVLGAPNRYGIIEPTELYNQILEEAGDLKPKCIALDASADVFAGNEIDRGQTRQFVSLLRKLAGVCDGSVILLSHPSLTGISSGTGISGSTAWHNSVRARIYLTSAKPEKDEQPDNDLRELVFKKNQYGKIGDNVIMRYQKGLFLPEKGLSSLEVAATEQDAEQIFLALLAQYARSGVNVSHKERANNFAPRLFANEPEAKKLPRALKALTGAMSRLFKANKIHVEIYDRHGHERIAAGAAPQP